MRQRIRWPIAVLALFLLTGLVHAEDRPRIDGLLDLLTRVRTFSETVISPDGKHVAWVERLPGKDNRPASHSAIYVADLAAPGSKPHRITAGDGKSEHNEHGLAWSSDGRLAFLSDAEAPAQLQLYVATPDVKVRKLTRVAGYLAGPRWSPDGKRLAVLFTENAPRAAGPLQPATPDAGVVEEKVYEQRLSLVDLNSGRVRPLSPPDLYVYEYDWSPDGKRFAAVAAHGSGDNNWYIAQLYTIATDSGETRSIWKPGVQIAVPRWAPDGKAVAVIGGLMSDEGANGGDIFLVPANGGSPRILTPDLKSSASWLTWLPGSRLLFIDHVDGHSGIATLDPADGTVRRVWKGAESILAENGAFNISLAADGKTSAVIRHSYTRPPEVWAGPLGDWKPVTHANAEVHPGWGKAESLHWKSDGLTVQGWLLFPRDYDPKRRYPLLVSVHGGPAWASRPAWPRAHFGLAALASEGYFVLMPNPRGSFGQGEAFTRGNVKDFGYGDFRDIQAGVDAVLKAYPVDPNRLALAGWSYGGYMTMWGVTQTNRFRAAVAGAGIANWQSYYGENGIDQWLLPYFGASVYDDPAVYARSAPITFIKRVKTPTLILVGDRDLECPAPQSYEFWHALKTFGVPNQFVVYPNEGHSIGQPRHQRDIFRRTAAWLNKYVRDAE
jgi:dipeptidyl aminopeptidase/acylaminoacyl peptidase